MKRLFMVCAVAAVLTGCNQNQGSSNDNSTGRGVGSAGDTGSNGKVYDRGGPPDSDHPGSQKIGSGRIDRGGGQTAGGAIDNSVPANTSPTGTVQKAQP
jgi:hypothetical protein